MLEPKTALTLAARLTTVAEFPRNQEAIDAVAEDLIDLTRDCENQESEYRIRKITQEVRRTWDTWTGTADLIRLYRRYWPEPREVKPEDNEVKNYGTRPLIECKTCNDTGAVKNQEGKYGWCGCITGVNLHFDMPDWLDLLNAERQVIQPEPPPPPHPAAQKIVSEEIEKTLRLNPDCPACTVQTVHTHSKFWQYHCKQEKPAL